LFDLLLTCNELPFYSNGALSPNTSKSRSIRTPTVATWLDDVALRDLRLHDSHAACVDARGMFTSGDTDSYQANRSGRQNEPCEAKFVYFSCPIAVRSDATLLLEYCTASVD